MRTPSILSVLVIFSMAVSSAMEVPKQAPLTRYSQLWSQSPFTTPPPPPESAPPPNPFEGMVLRGIIPLEKGGYLITIIDKKDPTKVTRIDTESKHPEFKIEKVEREPGSRLGTLVHLTKGSQSGTVGFDEALSVVKPTAPAKPQQPGQPPQLAANPGMPIQPPNLGAPGSRLPRQRVVQPPTPAAPTPSSSGRGPSSSNRPPWGRR